MADNAEKPNLDYRIVIGDSSQMNELSDESIQLIVTSPPYPMIEMWDNLFAAKNPMIGQYLSSDRLPDIKKAYELMHSELERSIRECARVLINGGICCINIGDAVRRIGGVFQLFANHSKLLVTLENAGLMTLPYILWKKPTNKPNAFLGSGFLPTNAYITIDCEYILIARKNGPRKFAPKDANRYRSKFLKKERDIWFSQIWDEIPGVGQNSNEISKRTGAFPIEIPRRLIKMFSIIGDTVLDPFMGTGTTLRAAHEIDRSFVGYEIDRNAILWDELQDLENLRVSER